MPRAPFLILLAGLAGCNLADDNLSEIIAFESAAECRLTPDARRIFDAMIGHDAASGVARRGAPIEIARVGMLRPTSSGPDEDGMVHAQLPLNGPWHDLTIVGLASGFVPNSGVHYRHIMLAELPDRARAKLNLMGFDLPPAGGTREFGDGMTEYISINRHGSGSVLECST